MIEVQHHILRMRFLQSHQSISMNQIYICNFGTNGPHAYFLRFQDGASKEHCADEICRLEHAREAAQRNRINTLIRMRILSTMGAT